MNLAGRSLSLPLRSPAAHRAVLWRMPGAVTGMARAGDILVQEGEATNRVGMIERGAVMVSSTSPLGRRAILAVLGPSQTYGLERMGERDRSRWPGRHGPPPNRPGPRSPEVRALVPSRVLTVPVAEIRRRALRDATVAGWVASALADRFQEAQRCLARSMTLRVGDRLVAILEDLARAHGRHAGGRVRIALPITQELLAALAGATRESVNRELRRLRARGLVELVGGTYVVDLRAIRARDSVASRSRP